LAEEEENRRRFNKPPPLSPPLPRRRFIAEFLKSLCPSIFVYLSHKNCHRGNFTQLTQQNSIKLNKTQQNSTKVS
jgi:hypothetical protein